MTVSLSSRDHQTNLGKRKNGRCEEDITKVSGKGWEQRVRSSVCYPHEGLSSALGYKLGKRWCADLRRSLGNFTLPTSIPLLCNSAGKNVAVSRNSTRSHLPPGGSFWVSYYGVTDSLISQWGVILYAGGLQFALRQRDLRLSFVCRSIARTSKKSLLSAPWNICPTAAPMAKHMATDVFSAMPTCTYKSKTLSFMINSCTYYKCRAGFIIHFWLMLMGVHWIFSVHHDLCKEVGFLHFRGKWEEPISVICTCLPVC